MAASNARTPRSKVQQLRAAAKRQKDAELLGALDTWTALDQDMQMRLAREIVRTRGPELRLAYPDVLAIAHGFRTSHTEGRRARSDEPCVTFMVARKWRREPKSGRVAQRRLPEYLYTYCEVGPARERRLCAVPTDIESGDRYRARAHGQRRYILAERGALIGRGVITCAVRAGDDNALYALSCHHVLALSILTRPPGTPAINAWARVRDSTARLPIGRLSRHRGQLVRPAEGDSFDAALVRVQSTEHTQNLRTALGELILNGHISSHDDMAVFCAVRTPDGTADCEYVQTWEGGFNRIEYFPGPPQPVQATIVEWQRTGGTKLVEGHSGSPVIDDQGRLLGVYIGGVPSSGMTFMIPADVLLFGPNYRLSGDLILETSP